MTASEDYEQLNQRVQKLEKLLPVLEDVKVFKEKVQFDCEMRRLQELECELDKEHDLRRSLEAELRKRDAEIGRRDVEISKRDAEISTERKLRFELEQRCAELRDQVKRPCEGSGDAQWSDQTDSYRHVVALFRTISTNNNERAIAAGKSGNTAALKFLADIGTDMNTKDKNCWTLLHHAAVSGYVETVKFLVEHGAHVTATTSSGDTPFHVAAGRGHKEVCELLLSVGAHVNFGNNDQWTPLHKAADRGHHDICKLLIASGAGVNLCNSFQSTPLHRAAHWGHLPVVQLLLQHDADVTMIDNWWCTAHDVADRAGHTEVTAHLCAIQQADP